MTETQTALSVAEAALKAAKGTLDEVRTGTSEVLADVAVRMRAAASLVEVGEGDAAIALLRSAAAALDATWLAGTGVGQVRN